MIGKRKWLGLIGKLVTEKKEGGGQEKKRAAGGLAWVPAVVERWRLGDS
jgi:hypothetical protein